MKAMIFAAGLGTRLKPLTDRMPKALVPVGGRPLLGILIEKLHRAGFDDMVINVHHFADMIEEWVTSLDSHPASPVIHLSDERKELLETGGGIKHARPLLEDCDRFLIHNVDILSNVDLVRFFACGKGSDATLLVSERKTSRYLLFDDDMRLVGWTNTQTGEVKSPHPHLDPSHYHPLAFAGIHQMSTSLFPLMDAWPARFSVIDFYLNLCASHRIVGHVQPGLRLMDVGKLDTLAAAEAFVTSL